MFRPLPFTAPRATQLSIFQILRMIKQESAEVVAIGGNEGPNIEPERKLKRLAGRGRGVSMERRIGKLDEYIRGWPNCFGISEFHTPIDETDGRLCGRLRMPTGNGGESAEPKFGNFRNRVSLRMRQFRQRSGRKEPWHPSRTPGTRTGTTNRWFEDRGLVSIGEIRVNLHYPAKARQVL